MLELPDEVFISILHVMSVCVNLRGELSSTAIISKRASTHTASWCLARNQVHFNRFANVKWRWNAYWIYWTFTAFNNNNEYSAWAWKISRWSIFFIFFPLPFHLVACLCVSIPQCENLWKLFCDKVVLLFVDEFIWSGSEQDWREQKKKNRHNFFVVERRARVR